MLVRTLAAAVQGIDARTIIIELNAGGTVAAGKQMFFMVGLPDKAVTEGFQRVEAAIKNIGYKIMRLKLVVNLAPANLKKEGSAYDLAIALCLLTATKQIHTSVLNDFMIMGELALDGSLRPIKGALPIAIQARNLNLEGLILPFQNAGEASIVEGINIYGVKNLAEAVELLTGQKNKYLYKSSLNHLMEKKRSVNGMDFSDVKGQHNIKRALEIAAAGSHNAILIGPPGAGKTMLAKRLSTILPPLSLEEALETTKIHSVSGMLGPGDTLITDRPYRSPHHTISDVALVGGGSHPVPGEISLAHNGVLFLDELPEFKRSVLEVLRQPMEQRKVTISRARLTVDFPASFMLIASMNPCPCGFYNHPEKDCVCGPGIVKKYLSKISGPLLDRIDLHVEVTPVSFDELAQRSENSESSESIMKRVIKARAIQSHRFKSSETVHSNAQMSTRMAREICLLNNTTSGILRLAIEKLQLSARAYDRILKVARTIADLDGAESISAVHLSEAIQFRSLDREGWAG